VISHVTAGRLQEMDGLPLARLNEPIWVTRQLADTATQRRGLVQRWSDIAPDDIVDLDGLRVTSVVRTATDLALHANRLDAVCFMESAMRLGASLDQLQHLASGRRGKRRPAPWWELADVRSENPLETRVRLHLIDADLAPDELQYESAWAINRSFSTRHTSTTASALRRTAAIRTLLGNSSYGIAASGCC
jgi:hypothetical protein